MSESAKDSGRYPSSISVASFGTLGRSWSATRRHCCLGRPGVVLGEGGGDEGGDDAAAALSGMGERVAHEVDAAALPGGAEDLRMAALVRSRRW